MRLGEHLQDRNALKINQNQSFARFVNHLSSEQQIAFKNITNGKGLSCIEGYAGTGKSYLLKALNDVYESEGYTVRAFGPDHATVHVLKEKGCSNTETLHRFLFSLHHEKRDVQKSKEVWMIDEAGKLGNRPLLELLKAAKQHNAQLIFSGDSSQLSSVERGNFFQVFSTKFGAEHLVDIQRQKVEQEKAAAKSLAKGKMGYAIDLLMKNGNIKWMNDKEEAKEDLIRKWALGRINFPNHSCLIIAHSNKEVRELNELARLYRKERGELGEKDYLCETLHGKILVSTGDKLEFRGNDKQLGLTNGMTGTLVEASSEKFTVLLNEGKTSRIVSFNPNRYSSFQLGYASTNFKSQGKTIDRVYVLHSKSMDKPGFYVALTRQAKQAHLFVSKTEAYCLSHLKKQAYRQSPKETIFSFKTEEQLIEEKENLQRKQYIQGLKESSSIFAKVKGYTLSTWDHYTSKASQFIERSNDVKADKSFFNPQIDDQLKIKNQVIEFKVDEWLGRHSDFKPELASLVQGIAKQEERGPSLKKTNQQTLNQRKEAWHSLSEKHQQALKAYHQSRHEASQWYTIVQADASHQMEWKAACAERNALAYQLTQSISKEQLLKLFTKTSLDILRDQSDKHAAILAKKENTLASIETRLKENFDHLAYKLFPEGPTKRTNKELRFGAKGSLCLTCRGEKAGSFYDHENKEGGRPLRLIQYKLGCNLKEAKTWAQDFLGQTKNMALPKQFSFKDHSQEKEASWISLKADPSMLAPSFEQLAPKLSLSYQEASRHAYKDAEGNLLFYVLRLAHKEDLTKKSFLHLSYGQYQDGSQSPTWALKGYQKEKKPLYQLEQLEQKPNAKVLIVEGEKAADAASKIFSNENIICLTWSGGASSVSKTDWISLYNREIVIWPDNDEAGFKAANEISSELRKVGVKSLGVVSKDILTKEFPAKWDLADPQPSHQPKHLIKDLILMANDKAVGLHELMKELRTSGKVEEKDLLATKLEAKEVLWRVEERMRPELEERLSGKRWEIHQEILKETLKILNGKASIENQLKEDLGIQGDLRQKLYYQAMIQQAQTGKLPSKSNLEEIKQIIMNAKIISFDEGGSIKELRPYIENKALTAVFEVRNTNKSHSYFQEKALEVNRELTHTIRREQHILIQQQKHRDAIVLE